MGTFPPGSGTAEKKFLHGSLMPWVVISAKKVLVIVHKLLCIDGLILLKKGKLYL